MQRFEVTNPASSGYVTISTSGNNLQYDVYGSGAAVDFPVDDEDYDSVVSQITTGGLSYRTYTLLGESVETILDGLSLGAGDHDDWDPAGLPGSSVLLVSASGLLPGLTGLARGYNGRRVSVINTGSSALLFAHQNPGSTAANRFVLPASSQLSLGLESSITFVYQGGSVNRWRVCG